MEILYFQQTEVPRQHCQSSQVDPVYTVQNKQLSLNGSSDQWRRPPCCVSIGESISLLQKVPGCHVLEVKSGYKGFRAMQGVVQCVSKYNELDQNDQFFSFNYIPM